MSTEEQELPTLQKEKAADRKHARRIETIRTIFGCLLFPGMMYFDAVIKPVEDWQWVVGLLLSGVKVEHLIQIIQLLAKISEATKSISKDDSKKES